jgi:hypothetical protein
VKGVVSNLNPDTKAMKRIVILAAAAALIAVPAWAQSIRISTAGKTPEQVRAEVHKAATQLCSLQVIGSSFPIDELRACVAGTVRTTLAQSSDPHLKLASR